MIHLCAHPFQQSSSAKSSMLAGDCIFFPLARHCVDETQG
jgi:hypothetical protein